MGRAAGYGGQSVMPAWNHDRPPSRGNPSPSVSQREASIPGQMIRTASLATEAVVFALRICGRFWRSPPASPIAYRETAPSPELEGERVAAVTGDHGPADFAAAVAILMCAQCASYDKMILLGTWHI